MTDKHIYEICIEIYEEDGQTGVYDFVLSNAPNLDWDPCKPCEDETPTVYLDGVATCCVCGTHKNIEE